MTWCDCAICAAHRTAHAVPVDAPAVGALLAVLEEIAAECRVDVDDVLDTLRDHLQSGLRRPGSWEREHVEALLLRPLEAERIPF